MESKNDTNQVYDRTSYQETDNNNKAKILPFAVSIDQIQSELGKVYTAIFILFIYILSI